MNRIKKIFKFLKYFKKKEGFLKSTVVYSKSEDIL